MLNSFSIIFKRNMSLVLPMIIIGILKYIKIISDIASIFFIFLIILLFITYILFKKEKIDKKKEFEKLFY